MKKSIDLQLFSTEKREPATPRRRQLARERGQVPLSQDLASAAAFFGGVMALRYGAGPVSRFIVGKAQAIWGAALPSEPTVGWAMAVLTRVLGYAALGTLPVMGGALLFGAGSSIAQTGLAVHLNLIAPDWNRLNPIAGMARVFSRRALVDCLRSLLKAALVALLAWNTLRTVLPEVSSLLVRDLSNSVGIAMTTIQRLLTNCSVFLVAIAALDYVYQWWENERSLMMSLRELKDELRDSEVKPEVKSAMRARQRQLARRRMMQDVPKADVVVTNPTHYAVALKYDAEKDPAPVVVAKGLDDLALRIRKVAEEAGVRLVQDPPLARALYRAADIGQAIPEELYKAVAEVLAYVYRLSGKGPREGKAV